MCVSVCFAAEFWSSYFGGMNENIYIYMYAYIYQNRFQGKCLNPTCASKSSQIYGIPGLLFVSATYTPLFFFFLNIQINPCFFILLLHYPLSFILQNDLFYPYCRLSFLASNIYIYTHYKHILLLESYVIFISLNHSAAFASCFILMFCEISRHHIILIRNIKFLISRKYIMS